MYGCFISEVVAYTNILLRSTRSSNVFNFAKASSSFRSGGNASIKSCCSRGLDMTDESDLLPTSALIMARNPNAYPVLLRRVELRTFSFKDISSIRRRDQASGRERISNGLFGFRQFTAICCSASRAAKAAPACFRVVSVLSKSCPTFETNRCLATYPSIVITEAIAAHVSFVNNQLPTLRYIRTTRKCENGR